MKQKSGQDNEAKDVSAPFASGPLLDAAEVGELLGVPKSWVWEQSRRGAIPTVRLGRYRRYRREAVERWIEELEDEGGRR